MSLSFSSHLMGGGIGFIGSTCFLSFFGRAQEGVDVGPGATRRDLNRSQELEEFLITTDGRHHVGGRNSFFLLLLSDLAMKSLKNSDLLAKSLRSLSTADIRQQRYIELPRDGKV